MALPLLLLLGVLAGGAQAQPSSVEFDFRGRGGARAALGADGLRRVLSNHRNSAGSRDQAGFASISQLAKAIDDERDLVRALTRAAPPLPP